MKKENLVFPRKITRNGKIYLESYYEDDELIIKIYKSNGNVGREYSITIEDEQNYILKTRIYSNRDKSNDWGANHPNVEDYSQGEENLNNLFFLSSARPHVNESDNPSNLSGLEEFNKEELKRDFDIPEFDYETFFENLSKDETSIEKEKEKIYNREYNDILNKYIFDESGKLIRECSFFRNRILDAGYYYYNSNNQLETKRFKNKKGIEYGYYTCKYDKNGELISASGGSLEGVGGFAFVSISANNKSDSLLYCNNNYDVSDGCYIHGEYQNDMSLHVKKYYDLNSKLINIIENDIVDNIPISMHVRNKNGDTIHREDYIYENRKMVRVETFNRRCKMNFESYEIEDYIQISVPLYHIIKRRLVGENWLKTNTFAV